MNVASGNINEQKRDAELPLVSAIVITYNQEKYIRRTLESILSQKTVFEYEILIGEDCSQDRTGDICLEFQKQDPEIVRVYSGNTNIGGIQKFLQTVRSARGKYIALCEGDDYWICPDKLQMQCDFLEENPSFTGVHTKVDYVDMNDQVIGTSALMPEDLNITDFNYLLQQNVIHTCSFMFRRDALDESVYSILSHTPIQDYALFLAVALKGRIFYFETTTAAYRKNAGVSSTWKHSNLIRYRLGIYSLLKKHYNLSRHRRSLYATLQYQYFHLSSIPCKGRENLVRCRHFALLLWYTLLSLLFKPDIRVHEISVSDVIKLMLKSRFRIKNWRSYLASNEQIEKLEK